MVDRQLAGFSLVSSGNIEKQSHGSGPVMMPKDLPGPGARLSSSGAGARILLPGAGARISSTGAGAKPGASTGMLSMISGPGAPE